MMQINYYMLMLCNNYDILFKLIEKLIFFCDVNYLFNILF